MKLLGGMSHGDIKPHNVLVSNSQAKLTDFGCSVLPDEMYTRTRENGGTILYSAPEAVILTRRLHGSRAHFKTDIYSLGVLLYHLVTSRLPHDSLAQVAAHTPFPRPREINRTICPALEEFILRCLELDPEHRWGSVAEMQQEFRRVKRFQLDYHAARVLPLPRDAREDWSMQAIRLMEEQAYRKARDVAQEEFIGSLDPYAFLLMIRAAHAENNYFDCVREIEAYPEMLAEISPIARDLRQLAISAYIETMEIEKAEGLVEQAISEEGEQSSLLLKKASLLGLQAQYEDARDVLLDLNRRHPGQPAIQKRLVQVFEQLRDMGKAAAFLKAYVRQMPEDEWARRRLEQYAAVGVW